MRVEIYSFINNFFKFKLKGDGNLYVMGILGAVVAGSFLMTGGILPNIEREPENPQIVRIDPNKISANEDSLQLINLVPLSPSPTPTPSPTPQAPTSTRTPSQFPTPTDSVQECYNNTVITLLLDHSASMTNPNSDPRYRKLENALSNFYSKLRNYPDAGIGAYGFGQINYGSYGAKNLLSSNFKLVKNLNSTDVNNLTNMKENEMLTGGTYMRSGFSLIINRIGGLNSDPVFRNYKKVAIIFSDGIPEIDGSERVSSGFNTVDCLGNSSQIYNGRCFSKAQDPRRSPSLTQALKDLGVTVYSIGIFDTSTGERVFENLLVQLLKDISSTASSPTYNYLDVSRQNINNLTPVFDTVFDNICS